MRCMSRFAVGLGVVALLMGCVDTTNTIRMVAVDDLDCAPEQLAVVELGGGMFHVSGCDQQARYECSRGELASTRCERVRPQLAVAEREPRVREKAARLLECDVTALEVRAFQSQRYVVEGCGKRIAYECVSRDDCCASTRPGVEELASLPKTPAQVQKSDELSNDAHAEVQEIIGDAAHEVGACYEAELDSKPALAGVVVTQLVIDPQGRVSAAAVLQSSLGARTVEDCIVQSLRRLRFPEPESRGIIVVTYPFVLVPGFVPSAACQ